MIRKALIAALLIAPMATPLPAMAQERVLTIFGRDPCPENTICVRAPETERYRIPKQFRNEGGVKPENQAWANRAAGLASAGASGPGSCTASGPGGWTGCWAQQMRAAKAERQQNAQTAPVIGK